MLTPKTYVSGPNGLLNTDLNRIEQELFVNMWKYIGEAPLDSFTGATDDDKLTAAMSYAAAQTHPPAIRLGNRAHSFSLARTLYDGFRLRGNSTISNSELADASMGTKLNLSTNGSWLSTGTTDKWDCEINGISAVGSSVTTFLGGTGIFHCGLIRDVSFKQFKTVLGTQAQKLLMTASIIDGWFQMQGTYNGGIHIGGSDNRLFMTMGLADASQAYNTAGNAAGQFHFWFDGLDNTHIGPLYVTAAGLWGAVKVTGSPYNGSPPSNRGMIWMVGATIEGQSPTIPCNGALIRVEGGQLKMHSGYIARAMSNPTAQGHTPTDAGYVHVTGGAVLLDGVTFDRYTGQAETMPMVYNNGGRVRIRDSFVATTGGTWSGLPRVQAVSGSTVFDDTMQGA